MRVNSWIFLIILTSAVVTWIPHFALRFGQIPGADPVLRFLKCLLIAIIFA